VTSAVHPFRPHLAEANDPRWRPLWERLYRLHFPTLAAADPLPAGPGQVLGHDVRLRLASGTEFLAEEKLRPPRPDLANGGAWGDVLLEFETNGGTSGWINGRYRTDYLAYLVAAGRWGFVTPWEPLSEAWARHGDDWNRRYRRPWQEARNAEYVTLFVCVPLRELQRAVPTLRRYEV
jgi:hypothetical protein